MNSAPTLETPRLLLRPWRDADVEVWIALNADARVMEFFPGIYDRARGEASAVALRERMARDGYGWWALEVKGGASFAGVIALQEVPFDAHFTPALEIGWRLPYEHWGHGYATEGTRAALEYAFGPLGRDELIAMTALSNVRSQRVMQRLGMQRDSRDDFNHPNIGAGHALERHALYRLRRDR